MFCQIFYSPEVKRCAIVTYKHGMYELYKHGIYELAHELPKSLGNIRKVSKLHGMMA